MSSIRVDIVSAQAEVYSGSAAMVIVPGSEGEFGIKPRHTPLLSTLKAGQVRIIAEDGSEENIYVSGGLLEVQPHIVTVLSDTALRAHDIDESAALKAKDDAERAMSDNSSDFDFARAQTELAEAVAQLQTLNRLRKLANR